MSTHRGTWKNFERDIAAAWTQSIGLLCKRNILSGASNRNDKGEGRPGDIVIHSDFNADVLVENKYRESFLHHRLYKDACKDAAKHGLSQVLLYTKQKSEKGSLVIMDSDLFHDLLQYTDVQDHFKKL